MNSDGTVTIPKLYVEDSRGMYSKKDIKIGQKFYCYCLDKITGIQVMACFKIIALGNPVLSIPNVVLQRVNFTGKDTNVPNYPAFICDTTDYVDDIPSGNIFSIPMDLTQSARTYNMLHQPKPYTEIIRLNDVVSEDRVNSVTGGIVHVHYAQLTYSPLPDRTVQLSVNGVIQDIEDFEIDTEHGRIYFDTCVDEFSFEDLISSADVVNVSYYAIY